MRILNTLIPILCIFEIIPLFLILALSLGFASEDAGRGFSVVTDYLWALSAEGSMSPQIWHLMALALHLLNGALALVFGRRELKASWMISLSLSALVLMNPMGLTAVIFASRLGSVAVLSCAFIALLLRPHFGLRAASLQGVALLFGLWGFALFPVLVFHRYSNIKSLFAPGLVWILGPFFMPPESWHLPNLVNVVVAPATGLVPGFGEWSLYLASGFYLVLAVFCRDKLYFRDLGQFFVVYTGLSFLGLPSDGIYYLALPFLYVMVVRFFSCWEHQPFRSLVLPIFLVVQCMWANELGLQLLEHFAEKADVLLNSTHAS